MKFQEIKDKYNLSNSDIAKIFGYKNLDSYQNSSAKKRIEKAITELYNIFLYRK